MSYVPGGYEPRREPLGQPAYMPPVMHGPPSYPPPAPADRPESVSPPAYANWTPAPAPKKRRTGLIIGLALAVLVVLGGASAIAAAFANGGKPATSTATPAVVAATGVPVKCADGVFSNTGLPNYCSGHGGIAPPTAAAPAQVVMPAATDFTLAVKVLKKSCFGSAGCNVTFRIDPTYTGAPFPAGVRFEVVYQVNGGSDGPQINRFTIGAGDGPGNSWSASVQEEELISIKSSSVVLTAAVTEVDKV